MDFGFSDEQQAIKETAREMLAKRSPLEKVREAAESRSYDDALWSEIRELGWPGIAIPEDRDGQGDRWLPGIASGGVRGAAAFEPRSNELVADTEGAAVLVLNDGDEAVLVEASDGRIEPVELIDATRSYARVEASDRDPLPGDVESA